ncbi:MAG: AAA family ATPase [Elainella sp. Prado103]|nr:AAA family ATPase [Elainella sp. Prado103]
MTLFDNHRQALIEAEAPLAARMRPRSLDEFIGQEHILGEGRLLRRAIQADQLASLIFYGPPGTGKTTLARIIANTTRAHFIAINAVLAGVKEIREAITIAQEQQGLYGHKTILFVDEVHRFNKAQQDALLPWVENGTVILIGATTENPYFEVNKALVSRSRIFQLKPLQIADLHQVIRQTLADNDRGYGRLKVVLDPDAEAHLVNVANGDARALLNALQLAVETTRPEQGTIQITLAVAEESIQRRAVLYDKEGDIHFDTISAFIKSIRGSDPDAALYWLARMVYAGEDPRFIFRRLLILASEDVGLADPAAVGIVNACAASFDRVGMPEGRYPLAQATLYLATAPKSNSVMGFFDALATIEQSQEAEVPNHLRDANRDRHGFGHGAGYLYPHAYRDHWVAQQYLPQRLQGQVFYQPSDQGAEAFVQQQVVRHREAQLAASVEGWGAALPEILTFSPIDTTTDRWLQRTLSQTGERLGRIRDRIFQMAVVQRHHLVLDLQAGSGLLTWEAVRQTPEGGVYAHVNQIEDANALQEQSILLPELRRPVILQGGLSELPDRLNALAPLKFDRMMGRNVLLHQFEKHHFLQSLLPFLNDQGAIVLAETLPYYTQRLYQLIGADQLSSSLLAKVKQAEEMIYADPENGMVNWQVSDLQALLDTLGLTIKNQIETIKTDVNITRSMIDRWFSSGGSRPSYGDRLSQTLSDRSIKTVRSVFERELIDRVVVWESRVAYLGIWKSEERGI